MNLDRFPTWTLRKDRALYRAHRAGYGPWWFSFDGGGRFDLDEPDGTCYLGSNAESAVRERWGVELLARGYIDRAAAAGTEVSGLRVPSGGKVADFTHRDAADSSVTAEIGATENYDITQAWAAALGPDGAGLRGVRYHPRFSTDATVWALGLFGPAGEADWSTDPFPRNGVDVAQELEIRVVTPPTLRELAHDGALIEDPPN